MKYAFVLTFVTCVALLTGQAQSSSSTASRCNLTPAQAPEIRGIRLGMTSERLLVLFPDDGNRSVITEAIKQSKRPNSYGLARFDLRPVPGTPDERFAGVNYITVELLDERVTSFHVAYAGTEWKSADQFAAKLSDTLHLPRSSWERGDEMRQWMKCDGFLVEAVAITQAAESWIRVQDSSAHRVVEDRRESAKEKKRQAFRP
jgi:hypothetical protein